MGVPMRPDLAELDPASSERAQLAKTVQSSLQDHTLFQDLTPNQTVREDLGLVRSKRNPFARSHQVRVSGLSASTRTLLTWRLARSQATLLDAAMLVRFHRGHQVFHQGTQARCLLMLVSGQLEVRRGLPLSLSS